MKKALVFGAGVSGVGAKATLEELGYNVTLIDDKVSVPSSGGIQMIQEEKIDLFVKSPGTPYTELVKLAKEKNIEVIDDIELGYRYKKIKGIDGKIIAITGTNGKTTVTSKISELLERSGYKSKVCGNIGFSFSQTVAKNKDLDFYVVEMSSYQLENLKEFKADIALIVNLAPDHMTRYKSVDDYYDTKFNITINQEKSEDFILNSCCKESMKRNNNLKANLHLVGLEKRLENQEAWCDEQFLYYKGKKLLDIGKVSLKGKHNLENMLFIVVVGEIIGIEDEKIREVLYNTDNLEHRMEKCFEYGKNIFINDSKGTNIESTRFAIEAFKNPILICGGSNKNLDLIPLAEIIKSSVKEVYLIGEIADILEKDLEKVSYPKEKVFNLKTLENVMKKLKKVLKEDNENVILFSPSTASFDQFKNFEERGRIFKKLVRETFE